MGEAGDLDRRYEPDARCDEIVREIADDERQQQQGGDLDGES